MKVVLLDPGHGMHLADGRGKKDPGAVAFGKTEAEMTAVVGEKVAAILEHTFGQRAFLTRGTYERAIHPRDYNPLSTRGEALSWRRKLADQLEADIFVSIHFNAAKIVKLQTQAASGTETLVKPSAGPESRRLAKTILHSVVGSLSHYDAVKQIDGYIVKNRGVHDQSLGVLPTNIPACLVECEFITNPVVSKLLDNDTYIWTLAHGIASGIYNYIGGKP